MNWPANRQRTNAPPAGAVIVTVTWPLFGGKLAPAQTGPRMPTHFTMPLPGTFASADAAHEFIVTLPAGEYAIERVA